MDECTLFDHRPLTDPNDIVAAARTWIGTPYQHQASLRGAGCDCLGLARGVWRELLGAEPELIPAYSADWAECGGRDTLLEAALRHFSERPVTPVLAGHVLIFRMRRGAVAKHVGIATDADRMIHAQEGVPVAEIYLCAWWRRRIVGQFAFPDCS